MKNESNVLDMNQADLLEAYETVMKGRQASDQQVQQACGQHGQFERATILRDTDIRYSLTTELREA